MRMMGKDKESGMKMRQSFMWRWRRIWVLSLGEEVRPRILSYLQGWGVKVKGRSLGKEGLEEYSGCAGGGRVSFRQRGLGQQRAPRCTSLIGNDDRVGPLPGTGGRHARVEARTTLVDRKVGRYCYELGA